MKPLVSCITPTRDRPEGLLKMIQSIRATVADWSRIQFVLKIDDDDNETRALFGGVSQTKIVLSPRGVGYMEMPRFVGEACDAADGDWCFLIDDDAWLEGDGWDEQLANIKPVECAAQCEFYHLGFSQYGSGSCGPNGLFVPTAVARTIPRIGGNADVALLGLTVGRGWPLHLLKGIAYCHDGRAR